MKNCSMCEKEWSGKGSKCNTCKSRLRRESQEKVGAPIPAPTDIQIKEDQLVEIFEGLPKTEADKLWWSNNSRMGAAWPNWEDEHDNECASCHKAFRTNLRLLKTCERCATV